ncbi:MAG: apolipoprotein N-acyltransferase, partial [SAR324 cluster bacterium]|nr:apolipoprotein N-acyltransferase [SAR324 cluster bacterium]
PSLAAQIVVPITGGAGLVLLLAAVNAGWAWAAEGFSRSLRRALGRLAVLACITILLLQTWPLPMWDGTGRSSFSALLIPGNFSNRDTSGREPRMRGFVARTLAEIGRLERDGARGRPPGEGPTAGVVDLIVWPEGAVQGYVASGKQLVELSQLAALLDADFLLGSDSHGLGGDYNSSYLVTAGRFDFKRYDKRELVPFGEYVPAGFRWFFGKKVTRGERDYLAGKGIPVLPWQSRLIGLAICFESILPGHMRRAASDGAEVIVTIANDHWLTPAARLQHLRLSALRALEIGRDLLFVSNGGWSAHVARGRVVTSANREMQALLARPLLRNGTTPWVRWGYVPFAVLLAGMACVVLLLKHRQGRA